MVSRLPALDEKNENKFPGLLTPTPGEVVDFKKRVRRRENVDREGLIKGLPLLPWTIFFESASSFL